MNSSSASRSVSVASRRSWCAANGPVPNAQRFPHRIEVTTTGLARRVPLMPISSGCVAPHVAAGCCTGVARSAVGGIRELTNAYYPIWTLRMGDESMGASPALPAEVRVVNVGLPLFADAVRDQGVPVEQVDWRI